MVKTIEIGGLHDTLPDDLAKYEQAFTSAGEALIHALELLDDPDFDSKTGWKVDCQSANAVVHYKDLPAGRYFAGKCKLKVSARDFIDELWNNVDRHHEWNDDIKQARRVRKLTNSCDISHVISNDVLIIKSREMLTVRALREINGALIIVWRSIELPDEIPESDSSVRAQMHLSVARATPDPADPEGSCFYDLILCCDLKGMMIKTVVDQVFGRAALKDMENIIRYTSEVLRPKLHPKD